MQTYVERPRKGRGSVNGVRKIKLQVGQSAVAIYTQGWVNAGFENPWNTKHPVEENKRQILSRTCAAICRLAEVEVKAQGCCRHWRWGGEGYRHQQGAENRQGLQDKQDNPAQHDKENDNLVDILATKDKMTGGSGNNLPNVKLANILRA